MASMYGDPAVGLNLVPLPANVMPFSTGSMRPAQAPTSNSLSRLPELQRFLLQCDDPSYQGNYFQVLHSSTPATLRDLLKSLKQRAEWLDDQQGIEYKRMKTCSAPYLPDVLVERLQPPTPTVDSATGVDDEEEEEQEDLNHHHQQEDDGVPLPTVVVEQHQLHRDSVTPPPPMPLAGTGKAKGKGQARMKGASAKRKRC